MKKVLFGAFALTYALTIQCMDQGLKTLQSNKNIVTRDTSIITRFDLSSDAANQQDQVEATESFAAPIVAAQAVLSDSIDSNNNNNNDTGSLRTNAPQYNSQGSRASRNSLISDPYPIDEGDDTWDIITQQDAKDAALMDQVQNILLEAQQLLPADLKSCININIHKSSNPLKDLETARELIWACMTRTDPNFASAYIETLTKNFNPCKQYAPDFDASKVYSYFAYDNEVAMQEPNETFAQLIQEKLEKASKDEDKRTNEDEKTQWFMRQFGFMFRDPATKQTYDAYLRGGQQALEALMIPQEQHEALQNCFDHIMEAKHALKELQKHKK